MDVQSRPSHLSRLPHVVGRSMFQLQLINFYPSYNFYFAVRLYSCNFLMKQNFTTAFFLPKLYTELTYAIPDAFTSLPRTRSASGVK